MAGPGRNGGGPAPNGGAPVPGRFGGDFGRVVIAGVGLMGGSLGMALRQRGLVRRVTGCDPDPSALENALRLGAIDDAASLDEAAGGADLIVLAAPVTAFPQLFADLAPALRPGAVAMDLGGVKRPVLEAVRALPHRRRFVGAHPMAGRERSGVRAADPNLFEGRAFAVVPGDDTDADAIARVWTLAEALGAAPVRLAAEEHDRLVAAVSHLPQVAAYALAAAVLERAGRDGDSGRGPRLEGVTAARMLAGPGYRDTTRLAESPPELWRDLALANRDHLLQGLDSLRRQVEGVMEALASGDGDALERIFQTGRAGRLALLEQAAKEP